MFVSVGNSARADQACRVIDDVAQWQQLETHWNRLLEATPQGTPWQSFEGLTAWWKFLSENRKLRIYVVESGNIPQLILPLQISTVRMMGRNVRVLEPIGMPDDINRPRLSLGPPDDAAMQCALDTIWQSRRDWDVLRLDEKSVSDPEAETIRAFAQARRQLFRIQPLHPCPYLRLDQDWDGYLRSRGRRLTKNLRASRRRLEDTGAIHLHKAETPEALDQAFEVLLEIQSQSWKHAEGVGLSASENYRTYVRSFLRQMAEKSAARILILYSDHTPVAATFAVTDHNTYYSAYIVHDQHYDSASPGTLLEAMELKELMQDGRLEHYDFFGAALNNKRRWTDDALQTYRFLLLRNTPANRLMDVYLFGLKPTAKRLRAILGQHRLRPAA